METKTETGKSSMNRGRRQLLIGAGLAPMVVTLHSAKVFGEDLTVGSLSGAAPFSHAIIGSGNNEFGEGTADTEMALYTRICDTSGDTQNTLINYYGEQGKSAGPVDTGSTIINDLTGYTFKSIDATTTTTVTAIFEKTDDSNSTTLTATYTWEYGENTSNGPFAGTDSWTHSYEKKVLEKFATNPDSYTSVPTVGVYGFISTIKSAQSVDST